MDNNQIITEQLKTLPPNVRQLVAVGGWAKTTDSIADQYYLEPEQKEKLKTEVMLTIIGLADANDLTKNITANIDLPTDLAEEITGAISRQVLTPLLEAWDEAAATMPTPVDPLTEAKNKFTKIANHNGRFPVDLLTKRFEALPKNVQDLVIGNEIAKVITPLSVKYDLHIDQGGILAEIAILVMLGLIKTTDFIAELENGLGITRTKAGDIAYEVDQKLFKPIREDLKKAVEVKEEKTAINAPDDIIHPHPAQKAYYGSAPQITPTSPATASSKITEQKLNQVVHSPKQDVAVTRTIDPYREPLN